jgi:peptide chain release factor 1
MQQDLLFGKLSSLEEKFAQIEMQLSDPSVYSDQKRFQKLNREHADLKEIVSTFNEYKSTLSALEENQEMLKEEDDEEMKALLREEINGLKAAEPELTKKLQLLLLPKDPNDERNVILEIRAGTGGAEAALFAGELFRMYVRYAERMGWKVEILSSSPGPSGGEKEVIGQISGDRVFSRLKYESGVHRVQRVPATETQGRVHTSACTVAVLPEADEVDLRIEDKDLKIDVYRASGPGGQSVNTTDSAVRITHLPSGLVVTCQDEKSQLKNKAKAMTVLRSRLYELEQAKKHAAEAEMRRSQVGSGDRSEKIRTYNFPQGRVSDHRINLTLYSLDNIINGALQEVIDPLLAAMQAEQLQQQNQIG